MHTRAFVQAFFIRVERASPWRLTLQNLKTGEQRFFETFEDCKNYLKTYAEEQLNSWEQPKDLPIERSHRR